MANRFRIEIYDANKLNDLTIYSDQGVDKEYLTELVFSNLRRFNGKVSAYVVDTLKKKKTTAMFINEDIVNKVNSKTKVITAKELHLAQHVGAGPFSPPQLLPPQLRGYPQPYGSYPQCPEKCENDHMKFVDIRLSNLVNVSPLCYTQFNNQSKGNKNGS